MGVGLRTERCQLSVARRRLMLFPSLLTLVALLVLAGHVAALCVLLQDREQLALAESRVRQIADELAQGQACTAVGTACSLELRTPARAMLLRLLARRWPAGAEPGPARQGYRDAPPVAPAGEGAQQDVAAERRRAWREVVPEVLVAIATGVLGASLGLLALGELVGFDGGVGSRALDLRLADGSRELQRDA